MIGLSPRNQLIACLLLAGAGLALFFGGEYRDLGLPFGWVGVVVFIAAVWFCVDAVADKVGPVWGWDDQGFMRNIWRRTPQDGLWVMGGGLNECRLYSRFLAVLITAQLEGLIPEAVA